MLDKKTIKEYERKLKIARLKDEIFFHEQYQKEQAKKNAKTD
jgi:hypothetical protein